MPLAHKILVPRRVAQSRITHLLLLLTMLLTACGQPPASEADQTFCQPAARWCDLVDVATGQRLGRWQVVEAALQSEQELHFIVELDHQPAAGVRGQVAGVNMAMGSMPMFIDASAGNRIEGRLLLPACTSEPMHWNAQLNVETDNGAALTLISPVFETTSTR